LDTSLSDSGIAMGLGSSKIRVLYH